MPNSTREWARRELERAALLIDWVGTHVNRVEDKYRALHPEIADPCLLVLQLASEMQNLITKIRGKI